MDPSWKRTTIAEVPMTEQTISKSKSDQKDVVISEENEPNSGSAPITVISLPSTAKKSRSESIPISRAPNLGSGRSEFSDSFISGSVVSFQQVVERKQRTNETSEDTESSATKTKGITL